MGSWSFNGPRTAITWGRGGGAGFSRLDGASATGDSPVPLEPKAVRKSMTTTANEAMTSPMMRAVCRPGARPCRSARRPARPFARGRRVTSAERLRRFEGRRGRCWGGGRTGDDRADSIQRSSRSSASAPSVSNVHSHAGGRTSALLVRWRPVEWRTATAPWTLRPVEDGISKDGIGKQGRLRPARRPGSVAPLRVTRCADAHRRRSGCRGGARARRPESRQLSGNLSVGMRQRLNLAIALLGKPDVLLLDEPTASLDPEQRQLLWETVATHAGDGGSVVYATQNIEEVVRAHRVARLREGELV